jgi:hypothetical protein
LHHVRVLEGKHLETELLDGMFSNLIILLLVRPVVNVSLQLDDQPRLVTARIGYVTAQRVLAPELGPGQSAVAKAIPEYALRGRLISTQLPRSLDHVWRRFYLFHACPKPFGAVPSPPALYS